MRHASLLILLIALFCAQPALAGVRLAPARQGDAPGTAAPQVFLTAPSGGQALQGLVEIHGGSAAPLFQSASLAFTYTGDTTGAWFPIHDSDAPVTNGLLARWDTTTITDGNYDLRLSVQLSGGGQLMVTVQGLRVRNYSPIETDTPVPPTATLLPGKITPPTPTVSPTVTTTPTVTPVLPTITPLPTNPAEISQPLMLKTLGTGGLVALGLLALLGGYLAGRSLVNRPRKPRKP